MITETYNRRGVIDDELDIAGYRLFKEDSADGRKGPVSSRCSLAGIGSKFDSEPLKNPR